MTKLNGIDISSYQSGMNLASVPCDFVIVKATEGTTYTNPCFIGHANQALTLGKKLGIYHFASGGNAIAEADYFVNTAKPYIGKALLVLDWEADAVSCGVAWAKQWLDRVHECTGVKPLIYMSNSVVNGHNWSSVASAGYGLWNAGYYAGYEIMGYNPEAPIYGGLGAWGGCAIYQYTSSGRIPGWGANLDLDVFYGDGNAWDSYAKGSGNVVNTIPSVSQPKPNNNSGELIKFTYSVRLEGGKILPEVTNLTDFAGIQGKKITDVAVKVNKGKVKYRVHVLGGNWLPWVTGCNWKDANNGYAGNGRPIDAIQIYYDTPADIAATHGYQKAQYRVSPINGNYYSWQYDDETINGQDGYAGCFGKTIDRFQLF